MKKTSFFKTVASIALVASLSIGALAACGGNTKAGSSEKAGGSEKAGNTADKIVIGGLAPLTGGAATYGTTANNGIMLAIEEANKAGGINGKQIEYVHLDEQGDESMAIQAYNKLKDDHKMIALIGDVTSKPSIAVAQRAVKDNIPMITPTGTAAAITLTGKNIFRVCFLDPDQGKIMADFAADQKKYKTVAILNNASNDYSVGLADAFEAEAEVKGIKITARETYGKDDVNFKAQLEKIKADKPDALYVPEYYDKDILIVQQAKEIDFNVPMMGGDGWDGILGQVSKDNPKEADGVFFTNHFSTDDTADVVKTFVKAYNEKYKEDPISFAALGYDAAKLMIQAITAANSTEADKITAAIQSASFKGVTGDFTFDENGDPLKAVSIIEVKDGKYTLNSKIDLLSR